MAFNRKGFSAKQSRRKSRQMNNSTIGTHVQHGSHTRRSASNSVTFSNGRTNSRATRSQVHGITPQTMSGEDRAAYRQRTQQRRFTEEIQHRARFRRILTALIVVVVVVGIAVGAGYLAFRSSIGSVFALKDSNAGEALVQVESTDPYYALVTADLGAVAEPLEKAGPDAIFLVRVDREAHTLAIVNIPPGLQINVDTSTRRLGDVALDGDAALITAVSTYAKVDISHIVKIDEAGVRSMIEGLGGIEVQVDQDIDDPHAGAVFIPQGTTTLDAEGALTYLRATNLTLGETDKLAHQTYFASLLLINLFGGQGGLTGKLDSIGPSFQTDLSLGDLEELSSWIKDMDVSDITRVTLPGYLTEVTGVVDTGDALYVAKAENMAAIIEALEKGAEPSFVDSSVVTPASPSSFTVEVQNGTDIAGAATTTTNELTAKGFKVEKSGNAEQQVFKETLIVYKDDANGPSQAKAVIDALGMGRAVDAAAYYKFDTDVLVVIGYDYKPVS
ncbi:MAG: LytR family transcriptional regulator [Coriobacteriaceae bacterium]|nr:LytR family transcriptional regulator [Coriobacteriaceae bacterium]